MDNHEPRAHAHAQSDQRRLLIVLGVTSAYFATELVGGYLTGSLALLSDAVHMLTDIAALCLGMLTLWISTRPASSAKTYGYLRAEILGALLNGLFLWVLVVFIWIEAFGRLRNPRPVSGLAVMAIAIVGICVNTFSAWMTSTETSRRSLKHGMAMRARIRPRHFRSHRLDRRTRFRRAELFHRMDAGRPRSEHIDRSAGAVRLVGPRARGRGYPDGIGAATYRSRRDAHRPARRQRHRRSSRPSRLVSDDAANRAVSACGGRGRRRSRSSARRNVSSAADPSSTSII